MKPQFTSLKQIEALSQRFRSVPGGTYRVVGDHFEVLVQPVGGPEMRGTLPNTDEVRAFFDVNYWRAFP